MRDAARAAEMTEEEFTLKKLKDLAEKAKQPSAGMLRGKRARTSTQG
jgi:hypothetical protein